MVLLVCFLFLSRCSLNAFDESNFKVSIDNFIKEQLILLAFSNPEMENSCFFHIDNHSDHFYITCPTPVDCYLQMYYNKFPKINDICRPCQLTPDAPSLPVDTARHSNEVLRALFVANLTMCSKKAQSIKTFQALNIREFTLKILGRHNCPLVTQNNGSTNANQCHVQIKYLNIIDGMVEFLENKSFCQFGRLEIIRMEWCHIGYIQERAFAHLLNLTALLLPSNQITHLPRNLFQNNANLQYVDLSYNQLQFPALKAFFTLASLKFLWLNDNKFTSLNDSSTFPLGLEQLSISIIKLPYFWPEVMEVEEKVFEKLTSLKYISLFEKKIEQLPSSVFKYNLQLEMIDLSVNALGDFPSVGHLHNLKELKIQWNKISSVKSSHLFNCSQLSHLNLSHNQLSFIEKSTFLIVRQLAVLDLSYNQLSQKSSNFNSSYIIFKLDLDYNNFTSFSFEDIPHSVSLLSIRSNQIETIQVFDFSSGYPQQPPWNLTSLDISNNSLTSIEYLRLPPTIQSVSFSLNHISRIMAYRKLQEQKLNQLHTIDLRNNNISLLCQDLFFASPIPIFKYFISSNPLKCSCENGWIRTNANAYNGMKFADYDSIYCHHVLPHLDAGAPSFVPIKTLTNYHFLCQSNYWNNNRCECPRQHNTRCMFSCPFNCTCLSDETFRTIYFMCNNKQFQNIPSKFVYADYFKYANITFDISGNSIPRIIPFNFWNLDGQIIAVILSNSKVKSIDYQAFDELTRLEKLDLSDNQLETLPNELFHHLMQLTFLNLSHNYLRHFEDDTFNSVYNLKYLYLHNNNLQHLELKQILNLLSLSNITLHKNPWSCKCKFVKSFRSLLVDSTTPIHNKLELNCTKKTGGEFNIANFNIDHCSTQNQVIAITISITLALLIVVTAGLVFKWRYELQVFAYARYGLCMFNQVECVEDKQYDAFLAYNSDDENFLLNDLMPGLEGIEKPYRLCIHHRDFPGGAYIQDSILDAIDMSSRTIIVLSESFVSSGWCRFEFKSAHMKMLEDRCPRILVILLGEVPEALDPEMKLYLKTNTYLKWGEKLFWQKLYYAMPDKRVTAPATDIMPTREL